MPFSQLLKTATLLRAALLLAALAANPALSAEPEPVLTARPGLCILQRAEEPLCLMAVELDWQAETPGDYCLHHSSAPAPLQCWQGKRQGHHRTELSSRENVGYWLQRPGDDSVLAKITVRVVSLAQRNPERRRRRHPWSLL